MKNSGKCPKCGHQKVLVVPGRTYGHDYGSNIPAGWFRTVKIDRYVCDKCGFVEHWVRDAEEIDKLRRRLSQEMD